jgi:isoleucyl-tRNA synthetase
VLEHYEELQFPADMYLEGGDQYRGWFNSSLMVGLAAHDRAPYRTVLTHGWVVDGQGKAMHKSAGNSVSPNDVIKGSGAEIIRLWCASSDYHEDMRCSDEILQRVSDAYRKMRNTARFALGNLDGFDPARDSVPAQKNLDEAFADKNKPEHEHLKTMFEIDLWALSELDSVIERVRAAYEAYEFHTVYHTLYHFCTVTLSARYFDIIKDRLYTAAPRSVARRSAQTALHAIADALARLLAPILVFTADEIWENIPRAEGDAEKSLESVHLAEFPARAYLRNEPGAARWSQLFEVRDVVLRALEDARNAKLIGSGLEARIEITAPDPVHALLERYEDQLRYIFIVSQVALAKTDDANAPLGVKVERAGGDKCERCWNYSTRVGESTRYPTACERCVEALAEIEREGGAA